MSLGPRVGFDRPVPSLPRKLLSSLVVIAAAAALPLFATAGAFRDGQDPFPHSTVGSAEGPAPSR